MQALSEFATQTFTTDLDKRVTFDIPGLREEPVSQSISGRNRFERSDVEVHEGHASGYITHVTSMGCLSNCLDNYCHLIACTRVRAALPIYRHHYEC